ncbi:MAG: T9SS type A sorting domain-containing protein [Ignavibacteriaceae bacterium]|nr:T9SS type A sorting domain-containing protein [Ignavibacteriaceae bacterium]
MKRYTTFFLLILFLTGAGFAPAQTAGNRPPKANNLDNAPIISGIPDQKAAIGQAFRKIPLWDYTQELDGDEVDFSVSGMVNLTAVINSNDELVVTSSNPNWLGTEELIVTVRDVTTNQYFDTDEVLFTVREEDNAPMLGDIPGQSIGSDGSFFDIDLNDYYYEVDGDQVAWKIRILPSGEAEPPPYWNFQPGNFIKFMTISAEVFSNGRLADDESGVLAAFINGELRGVAYPQMVGDRMTYEINVYSNTDGDTIRFRYFDGVIEKNLPVLQYILFAGQIQPTFPGMTTRLDAGNIVLQKDNNLIKVFHPDPTWAGTETAEIRVEDLETAAQLFDSVLVEFIVQEGVVASVAAPSDLNVAAVGATMEVTWGDNSNNETGFVIQRKKGQVISDYAYTTVGRTGADTASFVDSDIEELTPYVYRVYAISDQTQSGYSSPNVAISNNFIPPAVPTGLAGEPFNMRVDLSWNANSESDLAGYILYKTTAAEQTDSFAAVSKEFTSYSATGLTNDMPYSFRIAGYDTAGNISEESEPIFVSPVNHAPQSEGSFESWYADEDAPADTLYGVSEYFFDEDGDTLHYTVISSDSSKVIPAFADDKIALNYQQDAFGEALITIIGTDLADTAYSSFDVTINPVDDPTIIAGIPDQEFDEDSSTVIFLNQYVTDVDTDTTEMNFYYYFPNWGKANRIVNGKRLDGTVPPKEEGLGIDISIDEVTHAATITGQPDVNGTFDVVFGVEGGGAESTNEDSILVTIRPVNDAPYLSEPLPDLSMTEDDEEIVHISNLYEYFADIEDNELTFSVNALGRSAAGRVSGDTLYVSTVPDQSGTTQLIVTASDGEASIRDTFDVEVDFVNDAPVVAGIPEQVFNEDDSVKIFLNQYVTDSDNDTTEISFYAYLPEEESRPQKIISKKVNGNQVIEDNGYGLSVEIDGETNVATLKGDPDFFGEKAVVFVAYDPYEASSDQYVNVTINPVNDAPFVRHQIDDVSTDEDEGEIVVTEELSYYFGDIDLNEDELTFSSGVIGTVITSRVSGDTLLISTVKDQFGEAQVVVTASDGEYSISDTLNVTVNPVNDAPVLSGIPDLEFDEDSSATIFLNQYVTDIDNDTTDIFFDAYIQGGFLVGNNPAGGSKEIIRGKKENGNLVIEDNGLGISLEIDGETNVATITGDPDMFGEYNVVFIAYDSNEAYSRDTIGVTVNPVNDAPVVAEKFGDIEYNEDEGDYVITADIASYFSDVDEDELTFSANVLGTSVTSRISGDSLIVSTVQDLFGENQVIVTASDGSLSVSDTLNVTVTPINDPPVLSDIPDIFFNEDDSVKIFLNQYVTDIDNDTTDINFFVEVIGLQGVIGDKPARIPIGKGGIESGPEDLIVSLDQETNVVTFKATQDSSGLFQVRFVAWDPSEGWDEDSSNVTVLPVNDAPVVLQAIADTTFDEDHGEAMIHPDLKEVFFDIDRDALTFTANAPGGIVNARVSGDSLYIETIADKFGEAEVIVTASDAELNVSDTFYVTINPVNDPPVLSNVPDVIFNEDDSTSINLNSYVYDVDNDTTQISFDADVLWVDLGITVENVKKSRDEKGNTNIEVGTGDLIININGETNVATFSASSDSSGMFRVQFTAYDPGEEYDKDSINVTVNPVNDAPYKIKDIADVNINEDDGKVLVISDLYSVFGDIDSEVLAFNAQSDGTVITSLVSGDSLFVKTAADKNGINNVVVTAFDGEFTVSDTFAVNVAPVNDPPYLAAPVADKNYAEDAGTVTVVNDLKIHFMDIDGDTLEYMVTSTGRNSTAEIDDDALIISTHQDKFGSDTLIVTAYDDQYEVKDTLIVTILPVNDAPVLSGIPDIEFGEDDSTSILLNDFVSDVDNDTTQIRFSASVLSASNSELLKDVKKYTDGNGNEVIEVGTGDLKITIDNVNNIALVKVSPDSSGLFTVQFTAKDDSNATDTDTIDIRVHKVNDPPYLALPLKDAVLTEDAGTVGLVSDLKANFKDVDFDVLTYTVTSGEGPVSAFISGDSLYVTTAEDMFGTDTLIVTAYDSEYSVNDTMLVTLLPVNDAPVLSGVPDIAFNEDDSTMLPLNPYVFDVDNDTTQIRFTANVLSASNLSITDNIRRYTDEKGNPVIEVGTGDLIITIDNETNTAYFKASADSNGLFTVQFTAKDDSNATSSDTMDVRVQTVNDPPYVAVPLQDAIFPEDAGTMLVNLDLKVNFRDVDFDLLAFSVSSSQGPVDAFISGDSLYVSTIQDLYGTDTLIVTASDEDYYVSDTLLVSILPLNDAPVLSGIPDITFDEDDSTMLPLNPYVFDVDNDTSQISFTANVFDASGWNIQSSVKRYKDAKGNSVIEVGTGDLMITIDPVMNIAYLKASADSNGIFNVEFTATDDSSASGKDTMEVKVFKVNDPPFVQLAIADTTFLEDAGSFVIVNDLKQHFKDVDFDVLSFSVTGTGVVEAITTGDSLSISTITDLFGIDTLIVTAYDGEYQVNDTLLVNILAVNDAPVLAGLPDISFNEDDSTTITLNDYVADVDNDTTQLHFTANVFSAFNPAMMKTVRKYKDAKGYNVTEVGTGDLIIRIDSETNIAYISSSPDSNGVFGVEFTATDDSLAFSKDSIEVNLNAVNDPPYIFTEIPDTAFLEDAGEHLISADLKNNFKDVDFDVLSFNVTVLDTIINAEIRNDSLFIFTKQDLFGLSSIEVTASDTQYSVIDTIFVNILAVNDPPLLAEIPDVTFDEDESTSLYLNDYLFDIDNDTTQLYFSYTIERIDTTPVRAGKPAVRAVLDEEIIPVSAAQKQTLSGALIITIDSLTHQAVFSSGPDSNGVFKVMFTVTDDSGATATDSITVNLNPVNDSPVRYATIRDTTFLEDPGPIVMAPSIYNIFNDIDNDSLEFVVTFSEPGLQYSIIDSVFTIEPDSHFNGTRTAFVYASDGQYTVSDTFTVLVRAVNDQPRVADIPAIVMPEDTIYRFDLDQYAYDPDHDTTELVWMAEIIRNTQLENSIRKLSKKALVADEGEFAIYRSENKSVLKTAADSLIITINTTTHVATIVATFNFSGLDIPVVFTARDPLSLAGNDTTAISVIERNDPPVITGSVPQLTMNEDDSLQVLYTSFYPYISDPETPDSLLGIFVSYGGNNFIINYTPLSIQLKPQPNWFGIDTVYLSVTDYIDTVSTPVRVRVNGVNDLPYFINLPDSVRFRGDSSVTIPLWDYVEDLETPDSLMLFSFNRNNDSLLISYTASTGNLRLSSLWNFGGVVRLIITARDQGNALVRDSIFIYIDKFVGIDDENVIPEVYSLSQNYPNPFNPSTMIKFGLPKDDNIEITVFNIAGEQVRALVTGERKAGIHTVSWDGRNDYGNQLPSGIYFYRMRTSSFNEVKKLIMIK